MSIPGSLPSSEWRQTTAVAGELQLVEDPCAALLLSTLPFSFDTLCVNILPCVNALHLVLLSQG